MEYELYADQLFLVNFVMNLYLLLLVNESTLRTATPGRLLLGAAAGGAGGLLPFLLPGGLPWKIVGIQLPSALGMILIAFPVKGFRMFLKLLERMVLCAFCMGGGLLFLIRCLPMARDFLTGIFGVLGLGGLCCLFMIRFRQGKKDVLCPAVLCCGERRVRVDALVDSGNSLTEPISGKPVCIVEKQVLESLREWLPPGVRAIPCHSIGMRLGILEGYLLPELQVEKDGVRRCFRKVWIAAGPQGIHREDETGAESVKMIINPMLFSEPVRGKPRKRQNERKYDTESNNAG